MIIYSIHFKRNLAMEDKKKEPTQQEKLKMENAYLRSKIAYSLGSLETINYLLKNEDPLIIKQNLKHLRTTVDRVLSDLRKEF